MTTMLEGLELALRQEVERQVQAGGYYNGPRNGRPNYVDADLDYPAMARAVLMAVREPDEVTIVAGEKAAWDNDNSMPAIRAMPKAMTAMIDHILGEEPKPQPDKEEQFKAICEAWDERKR